MKGILTVLNPDKSRLSLVIWPADFEDLEEMARKIAEHLNEGMLKHSGIKLVPIKGG